MGHNYNDDFEDTYGIPYDGKRRITPTVGTDDVIDDEDDERRDEQ